LAHHDHVVVMADDGRCANDRLAAVRRGTVTLIRSLEDSLAHATTVPPPGRPHVPRVPRWRLVIVVVGEALIDLAVHRDGTKVATAGGAPFNVARACGRLGADVAFGAAISTDAYGQDLLQLLRDDGVDTSMVLRTDRPTTVAHAELDDGGVPVWRFDIEGTSSPEVTTIEMPPDTELLFTGGLALVLEPMASTVDAFVPAVDPATLVMVDLNCRPAVIGDRGRYVQRVDHVVARADVVKASDEDLAFLHPDLDPLDAARAVRDAGSGTVLVTAGDRPTTIVGRDGERTVAVRPVPVVDTIGAGDAFAAGFVTWWLASGRHRDELAELDAVTGAVEAGHTVAALAVGRQGADPPRLADLPPGWLPAGER
jgi:fructokinase